MGKSNRRDPRVNIGLDVRMSTPAGFDTYRTKNISYRGIFIVSMDPLPLRRLTRLTIPGDGQNIEMLGMVAHRINTADAAERGIQPGMGINLFPCGSGIQQEWRDFIDAHLERDPALRQSIHEHNLPRLKIHIKDVEVLKNFAQKDVPAGGIFYRTPDLHPVGAEVMLEIQHPSSGGRFLMKASVTEAVEGGRRHRGMQILFDPMDDPKRAEFQSFVEGT